MLMDFSANELLSIMYYSLEILEISMPYGKFLGGLRNLNAKGKKKQEKRTNPELLSNQQRMSNQQSMSKANLIEQVQIQTSL